MTRDDAELWKLQARNFVRYTILRRPRPDPVKAREALRATAREVAAMAREIETLLDEREADS